MNLLKQIKRVAVVGAVLSMTACVGDSSHTDLDDFMAQTKTDAASHSAIDPIPAFRPYTAFNYAATAFRAPFDVPLDVKELVRIGGPRSDVKPDPIRTKEYLEQYNFEALDMVGSLRQKGQLWVLIDDGNGGVHRVTLGNYLGRNHGRIIEVSESQLSVIEIVSSGSDSWIERPRTLKLQEKEG